MTLIHWLLKPFRQLRNRWILAKAYPKMKRAYNKQLAERRKLRTDINLFLKDFFGIDAKSKYIPKDFKNKEEVRVAVCAKFEPEMNRLNLQFSDLFS